MLRFQWNALRRGHPVIVHDPESSDMTVLPGVVVMIDAHTDRKGANGVGIRVGDVDGSNRILWPSYLAVHLEPLDPTGPCWRCQEIAARLDRPPAGARVDSPVAPLPEGSNLREMAGPPAPRLCGRCRELFPGDATLPLGLDTGWWACPACHDLVIGPGAMAVPTWPLKAAAASAAVA